LQLSLLTSTQTYTKKSVIKRDKTQLKGQP